MRILSASLPWFLKCLGGFSTCFNLWWNIKSRSNVSKFIAFYYLDFSSLKLYFNNGRFSLTIWLKFFKARFGYLYISLKSTLFVTLEFDFWYAGICISFAEYKIPLFFLLLFLSFNYSNLSLSLFWESDSEISVLILSNLWLLIWCLSFWFLKILRVRSTEYLICS